MGDARNLEGPVIQEGGNNNAFDFTGTPVRILPLMSYRVVIISILKDTALIPFVIV